MVLTKITFLDILKPRDKQLQLCSCDLIFYQNLGSSKQKKVVLVQANIFITEDFTMCMKDIEVKNQVGLHARPATFFIQKANEFKSSIWVEKEERRVNAKSLLGILSLGIVGGANIRIIADGSDEQLAVDGLVKLVESGFAE